MPDPTGLIHRATTSVWKRSVAGQTRSLSELVHELTVMLGSGDGNNSGFAVREGVLCLPAGSLAGTSVPQVDLVLYRLAMPWVIIGVVLRDRREEVRRRLSAVAGSPGLEAIFLVSADFRAERSLQVEKVSAAPGVRPPAACRRH